MCVRSYNNATKTELGKTLVESHMVGVKHTEEYEVYDGLEQKQVRSFVAVQPKYDSKYIPPCKVPGERSQVTRPS